MLEEQIVLKDPDFEGWECKSQRKHTKSASSLFTRKPDYPHGGDEYMRENWGVQDTEFPNLKVFRTSIYYHRWSVVYNKYKMKLSDELSLIAIQGPEAKNVLGKIIPEIADLKFMHGKSFELKSSNIYITRSGYTGEDGFEISMHNDKAENFVRQLLEYGSKLIGLGARDTLRLEAGLCLYGNDIDIKTSPIEANLKWAIAKRRREEGGFNGWDKIKKLIENGSEKKRVGILPEGRVIARENTKIFSESGEEIGLITSGTFGPSVNAPVAMGYINTKYAEIGTKIQLEVRGKKHGGKVSELPFFKKSYVK